MTAFFIEFMYHDCVFHWVHALSWMLRNDLEASQGEELVVICRVTTMAGSKRTLRYLSTPTFHIL